MTCCFLSVSKSRRTESGKVVGGAAQRDGRERARAHIVHDRRRGRLVLRVRDYFHFIGIEMRICDYETRRFKRRGNMVFRLYMMWDRSLQIIRERLFLDITFEDQTRRRTRQPSRTG